MKSIRRTTRATRTAPIAEPFYHRGVKILPPVVTPRTPLLVIRRAVKFAIAKHADETVGT